MKNRKMEEAIYLTARTCQNGDIAGLSYGLLVVKRSIQKVAFGW